MAEASGRPPQSRSLQIAWVVAATLVCLALIERDRLWSWYWEATLPRVLSGADAGSNGVDDADDLVTGARRVVARAPVYKSAYYFPGGYPPEGEGVCTDLVWRAFKWAGYDLKALIDADIKAAPRAYYRVAGKPDPAIDFRRVPNQKVFFLRHAQVLSTELIPGRAENLAGWQAGDIVTFVEPDHVAILSDKRNADGVPYMIHHVEPRPREGDDLPGRYGRITGHFRLPLRGGE